MKQLSAIAIGIGLTISLAGAAKADTLISGSVYNQIFASGNTCSSSSSSASGLSLSCSDPSTPGAFAALSASAGATNGTMAVMAASLEQFPNPLSYSSAHFTLSVTGMYLLTGGTGLGYADLTANEFQHGEGGGGTFNTCSLTLDGQTQGCGTSGTLDFLVTYNTPLNLDFEVNYSGAAEFADGINSGVNYDFNALTPPSPMPEPASLALVGIGMMSLALVARYRVPGPRTRD